MKQIFLILSLFALFFSSCDRENIAPKAEEFVEGNGLNPELSADKVFFSDAADSAVITTKYPDWVLIHNGHWKEDSTAVLEYNYATKLFSVTGSWYSYHRVSDKRMVIKVKENPTSQSRQMRIPIRCINWHGYVKFEQSGKK